MLSIMASSARSSSPALSALSAATRGSDRAAGTDELTFLAELDVAGDRATSVPVALDTLYGGTGWREDLTRRLRVVLHAEPLLAMRALDDKQAADRKHYDSLAIALRVFDLVLASMGLDRGVDRAAVQRNIGPLLASMDAAADIPIDAFRHEAVVDRVLGALLNDGQRREKFRAVYTDVRADGIAEAVSLPFRLLEEYQTPDGGLAFRLTSEAINLFLGALDRDIEDEQVAAEALIREQLERGSFAKAVQSAENAQIQSRRYLHYIDTKLRLTRRDTRLVNWGAEMSPLIDQAYGHVQRRVTAERTILEVASDQAKHLPPGSPEAGQVARIKWLITQCFGRHATLSTALVKARSVFLSEQGRQGFTAATEGQRPDFVRDVLEPLLREPTQRAVIVADVMLSTIAAPQAPGLLDLTALIGWCLRPRREIPSGEIPVPERDVVDLPSALLHFSPEIRRAAETTLRSLESPRLLSALLAQGSAAGWPPELLDCITLTASLEHGRDAQRHSLLDVVRTRRRFTVGGISGDDLALLPTADALAIQTSSHATDETSRALPDPVL